MIEATGLTKRLGGRAVVSDVSFRCEPGTVTGFLGPNGAGKTTTMRMVVGLSTPDAGRSQVLDRDYHAIPNPGRHVGVLLDASAQHPGRSGREALAISAQMMGVPESRVDELLTLVGPRQVGREEARAPVLARHAPAARPRARAARRPAGADPRRARQRPRPRGHPLDARPAARLRRPRRHRLPLQPPAERGRGRRRPPADHRQRQDRRRRHARGAAGRHRRAGEGHRPARARERAPQRRARRPARSRTAPTSSTPTPSPSAAPRSPAASSSPTWPRPRAQASRHLFFELTETPA